jgi:hypothetical protein
MDDPKIYFVYVDTCFAINGPLHESPEAFTESDAIEVARKQLIEQAEKGLGVLEFIVESE